MSVNFVGRPPRGPLNKNKSSMGLVAAGKKIASRTSRAFLSDHDSQGTGTQMALIPSGPRQRAFLQNQDGTQMTTPDYLVAANQLQKGEPCTIANFGLDQSSFQEWVKLDQSTKQVKTKDHKTDINNAKRLIAKYAREEQLAWEQNLKDKGLWTQAQEERKQKMSNKHDFELYAKLESNFMHPIESAEQNLIRAENAVSMSMDDGLSLLQKVNRLDNASSQQNDYMDIRQTVEMMP